MIYSNTTGQITGLYGVLKITQNETSPFQQVVLYNQDNANFSLVSQGLPNQTNGEMLMVQYSAVPRPGFFMNLTGAYVFGEAIANSNMLKLLYLCNNHQCLWDTNKATAHLVYINPDTRIFKINYNATG